MKFECQGKATILNVTESKIKNQILRLRSYGPCSYASLTDSIGNYIQVAGGGVTCMVEQFQVDSGKRLRAYHHQPSPIFPDGTILAFGAGELRLKSDEWFIAETVVDLFLCFFRGSFYPDRVFWRDAPGF